MQDRPESIALKTIVKGAGISLFGGIFGRALGYLARVIMARYLGPGEYGLFSLAISVFGVVAIFVMLGLPVGIVRFVSEAREDNEKVRSIVKTSVITVVFISIIVSIVMFYLSDFMFLRFFGTQRVSPLFHILLISLPFSALAIILESVAVAYQKISYRMYAEEIVKNIVRILLMTLFFYLGYDVIASVIGYTAGVVASAFAAFYFIHKKLVNMRGKWSYDRKVARNIISYSWPLALSTFLLSIVIQLDTIMMGHFLSERDVGLYNAALPTAQIVIMVPAAIGSLLLSTMTTLYTSGKIKETESIYKSVTKWLFAFTIPITLLLVIFSREIILAFFGVNYIDGSLSLRILAVGIMVSGVFYPSNDIINMLKKTKIQLYAAAASLFITVSLNYMLIPKFGLSGAATATSLSLIFLSIFLLFFSHRYSGLNPLGKGIAKPFVSCIVPVGIVYAIKPFVSGAFSLALAAPFLIAYFLSLKAMHFFSVEDRMILDSIKRKFSGG